MTIYRIEVSRDDRWWMIRIPQLDGVNGNIEGLTQARRYADIGKEATNYICTVADVAPSSVELDVTAHVGDTDVTAAAAEVSAARAEAARQEAHAMALATATARRLAADGVPVRDIGAVLGVTFQRAAQLANS
ncbi:HicB family toxin-antitoxin system [Nocardia asteroides]|uniref:HicB family toxin-antitoxin system n=1 Tax=Nocardia asteroides TaxID=1824 RepID=UPI001E5776E4|nr:HicB family toxin-antitoxin system [Nocardia asteroides]UGT53166.1 HicB family toxin-antitoxin system [Nocardia asteroides]